MKIKNLLAVAVVSMSFLLASCGGGPEADVKKMVGYMCESAELGQKMMKETDEAKKKELQTQIEELGKKAEEFGKEMKEKYKDQEGNKELEEKLKKVMEEEMKNCEAMKGLMGGGE